MILLPTTPAILSSVCFGPVGTTTGVVSGLITLATAFDEVSALAGVSKSFCAVSGLLVCATAIDIVKNVIKRTVPNFLMNLLYVPNMQKCKSINNLYINILCEYADKRSNN